MAKCRDGAIARISVSRAEETPIGAGLTGICHVGACSLRLRGLAILLLAILLPLVLTCCGPFGGPPKTPANQRYGYVGADKVLKWDASAGAESYTVYHSPTLPDCRLLDGRPFICQELASGIQQPNYILTQQGFGRHYWVVACNSSGCSEIESDNPAQPPPPFPDDVHAVQAESSIRIIWNSVPGAAHYKIYTGCPDLIDCIVELDGNVVGTAYTHEPRPIPPQPDGVRVIDRSAHSMTVQWHALQGGSYTHDVQYWVTACYNAVCSENDGYRNAAFVPFSYQLQDHSYQLSRRTRESEYQPVASNLNRPPYVDEGLHPSTIYFYRVHVCNDNGCSPVSDESGGLTESDGPVESPLRTTGVKGERVRIPLHHDFARVNWDTVKGATYYEVYQGTVSDPNSFRFDSEVSAPQVSYMDPTPNVAFGAFRATAYKIRACNKAGCSPFSESIAVR